MKAIVYHGPGEKRWEEGPAENSPAAREKFSPLLQFSRSGDRLSGLPLLATMYPAAGLGRLGDPLAIARDHGALAEPLPTDRVLDIVRERIREALAALGDRVDETKAVDRSWYWAAPFLLDTDPELEATRALLSDPRVE